MRPIFVSLGFFLAITVCFSLAGCGTNEGPSLLVQKNVNGSYRFSADGAAAGPLLFTANLASGDPVAPSGANYYSTVTGTIMNGPGMDLTDCNGQAIPLTGKITNPDHNNVYINMTGPTAGGGTMTMDGTLGIYIQGNMDSTLCSTFGGTIRIDGGSCPMSSTDYVAQH